MSEDSKLVANGAARRRPPAAGIGRKKGVPNKATRAVKEALWLAYEGLGGAEALRLWATKNPTEFFKLWGRMMPTEVTGPDGGPIQHEHEATLAILELLDKSDIAMLRRMAEKLNLPRGEDEPA